MPRKLGPRIRNGAGIEIGVEKTLLHSLLKSFIAPEVSFENIPNCRSGTKKRKKALAYILV